jgi:hypothetical protein
MSIKLVTKTQVPSTAATRIRCKSGSHEIMHYASLPGWDVELPFLLVFDLAIGVSSFTRIRSCTKLQTFVIGECDSLIWTTYFIIYSKQTRSLTVNAILFSFTRSNNCWYYGLKFLFLFPHEYDVIISRKKKDSCNP